MGREKRVVNNSKPFSMGNWNSSLAASLLEKDGIKMHDKKMENAKRWFCRPSYYQSEEGVLSGGMKRKTDLED
jgi:hypothetical protein